jgi:hypothetical protein
LHGQDLSFSTAAGAAGWTGGVSFYGFDLGVWQTPPLQRDVDYEIWNGDFSTKLASGTVNVGAVRATGATSTANVPPSPAISRFFRVRALP